MLPSQPAAEAGWAVDWARAGSFCSSGAGQSTARWRVLPPPPVHPPAVPPAGASWGHAISLPWKPGACHPRDAGHTLHSQRGTQATAKDRAATWARAGVQESNVAGEARAGMALPKGLALSGAGQGRGGREGCGRLEGKNYMCRGPEVGLRSEGGGWARVDIPGPGGLRLSLKGS